MARDKFKKRYQKELSGEETKPKIENFINENEEENNEPVNLDKGIIKVALLAIIAGALVYKGFFNSNSANANEVEITSNQQTSTSNTATALAAPPNNNQPNVTSATIPPPTSEEKPNTPPSNAPATSIKFDKLDHNFGTIKQHTSNDHIFKFTNTGDKPLIINSALGSCGCTVPEFPKEPIAPGETGEIAVTYKPGTQQGSQKKSVTVTANTTPPNTYLVIAAEVEEAPAPDKAGE